MSSRNSILKSIRAQLLPAAERPDLNRDWLRYPDPWAQFQTQLAGVGGQAVRVANMEEVTASLALRPEFVAAKEIVSTVPGIAGNIDLESVQDPHALETTEWAILPAQFAVAENGAVWVTDQCVKHRVIYFLTQHLVLVLPAGEIVHNMHEAYARVTLGESSLGLFMSGPSKTADIEQSLVIGAHGPRSLTVFCVGD